MRIMPRPRQTGASRRSRANTGLLKAWRRGNRTALVQLTPLVYQRLRAQPAFYLKMEQAGQSLDATALVHERGYGWCGGRSRLAGPRPFFALAGRLMRRILVDGARGRASRKRGRASRASFHPD